MSKSTDIKDLNVLIKASALRTQYNRGVELYFSCLERINEIKNDSDVTLDKVELTRAKSQKFYYSKLNKQMDGFITDNMKLSERMNPGFLNRK